MNIMWVGCHRDHYADGRHGPVRALCIHHMDGSMSGTGSWFNMSLAQRRASTPNAGRSSAHFGIPESGEPSGNPIQDLIHQYVDISDTAFANGIVQKLPQIVADVGGNPNDWTVSIELEGFAGDPVTDFQLRAIAHIARLAAADPYTRYNVLKHDDITFTACPGIDEAGMAGIIAAINTEGDDMDQAAFNAMLREAIGLPGGYQDVIGEYLNTINRRLMGLEEHAGFQLSDALAAEIAAIKAKLAAISAAAGDGQ